MGKKVFIAEKPSVAAEFAKALHVPAARRDGYMEGGDVIVTWCVGHLITMSYPDAYDPALKRWSMGTLPFIPAEWKYEVIDNVKKQFNIVKGILTRPDVDTIYICTDSGREGEYIYRLVDQMAGVTGKVRKRVWIDSQTEEEIQRGIREALDWTQYDRLADSAYLRAKEDYLMGINFSRVLTLAYSPSLTAFMNENKRCVVSVGRVMTCVLGMVVRREREIRDFVKTPFYRVAAQIDLGGSSIEAFWKVTPDSPYFGTPKLYKDNGFLKKEDAQALINRMLENPPAMMELLKKEKKKETKNPPLLFNLAELQNTCSRKFKISPDETLSVVQELYEKKMVTYPRTDARVLSSAIAKQIDKNLNGLTELSPQGDFAKEILSADRWKSIGKTRYTDDKQITDHYAIIPTGQGLSSLKNLRPVAAGVYFTIVERFLSIFYPPAVYQKYNLEFMRDREHFFAGFRMLEQEGYLKVTGQSAQESAKSSSKEKKDGTDEDQEISNDLKEVIDRMKKGQFYPATDFRIREGETQPPKRYTSGSLILAMENAGQLIEDEELRAQIKGSGIGTSATRAEILKKLVTIRYLALNKKTQVVTPQKLGEAVFEVVNASIRQLLNPELTASWEKGLTYVSEGTITADEYMAKLSGFVTRRTEAAKQAQPQALAQTLQSLNRWYR